MESLYHISVGFLQSILSFFKILLRSKLKVKIPLSSNKKCLILGNGPSVKQQLSYLLTAKPEVDLLCLNKFPDTEYFESLKPQHFVLVSTEFWQKGTIKEYNEVRDNIIVAIIAKTIWPLNVFLPASAAKHKWFIDQFNENNYINLVYYNTTPVEGTSWISNLFFNIKWGTPRPHNVLIPSIFNSIWMGYKEIGLIGADHSWLETLSVSDNNEALLNQKHFYDEGETSSKKMTRKGSSYRKLHEILEKFMLTFKAYFIIKDYVETKNIKIFNCTPSSYIDAFERKTLEEFLDQ